MHYLFLTDWSNDPNQRDGIQSRAHKRLWLWVIFFRIYQDSTDEFTNAEMRVFNIVLPADASSRWCSICDAQSRAWTKILLPLIIVRPKRDNSFPTEWTTWTRQVRQKEKLRRITIPPESLYLVYRTHRISIIKYWLSCHEAFRRLSNHCHINMLSKNDDWSHCRPLLEKKQKKQILVFS
jgi:hypothetical protein